MNSLRCIVFFGALTVVTAAAWGETAGGDDGGASSLRYFNHETLRFPLRTSRAGAAPIARHELWMTRDGGATWSLARDTSYDDSQLAFTVSGEGRYGFIVIAIDEAGHRHPPPKPGTTPQVRCVVDTTPPTLEMARPDGNARVRAGGAITIGWKTQDAHLGPEPVRVYYRRGAEDIWQEVIPGKSFSANHRLPWHPPLASGHVELRVVAADRAGNETVWITPAPVEVIPFDGFRGSKNLFAERHVRFRRFPIHYRVTDLSPILLDDVEIWVRRDFGAWERHVDEDGISPYVFEAPDDGAFFFYLRATDRNGVSSRAEPGPDSPADLRSVVDTRSPTGSLQVAGGGKLAFQHAGAPLKISWSLADDNLARERCRLEASFDGGLRWRSFAAAATDADGAGEFTWFPPYIETEQLTFRLVAEDRAGNRIVLDSGTRVALVNPRLDPAEASREHRRAAITLGLAGDRASLLAALESFAIALEYDPSNARNYHDRGAVLTRLGRHEEALADYRKAHHFEPDDIPYAFSLIQGLVNLHIVRDGAEKDDLDDDVLAEARREIRELRVRKQEIYAHPDFRELLATYELLEKTLKGL